MKKAAKTAQLQIRVSVEEKRAIVSAAKAAGMSMSDWLLSRALGKSSAKFRDLVDKLSVTKEPGAVLNMYLSSDVAALVEQACMVKDVSAPKWVTEIKPLPKPVFISELKSLRLHLLLNAPPAFRGV